MSLPCALSTVVRQWTKSGKQSKVRWATLRCAIGRSLGAASGPCGRSARAFLSGMRRLRSICLSRGTPSRISPRRRLGCRGKWRLQPHRNSRLRPRRRGRRRSEGGRGRTRCVIPTCFFSRARDVSCAAEQPDTDLSDGDRGCHCAPGPPSLRRMRRQSSSASTSARCARGLRRAPRRSILRGGAPAASNLRSGPSRHTAQPPGNSRRLGTGRARRAAGRRRRATRRSWSSRCEGAAAARATSVLPRRRGLLWIAGDGSTRRRRLPRRWRR